jgi:hypothetical protein
MGSPAAPLNASPGFALARSIAESDFNHPPRTGAGAFKQWVHTTVSAPEISFVANASWTHPRDADPVHRLVVLVYAGDVCGNVRQLDARRCRIPLGRSSLQLEDSRITATEAGYDVVVIEPALAVTARLRLHREMPASTLHNLRVGRSTLNWCVLPRLAAFGAIEYQGHTYQIANAPAYRDRNWGNFEFGEVSWDWGYAHSVATYDYSIVVARLMDRTRNIVVEQEILIWLGPLLLASLRGPEIRVASSGRVDERLPTIPPALALCRPGRATDVAREMTFEADSARGRIQVRFERRATARILVPNDGGLGTTAIYESTCHVEVRGHVEGHDLDLAGTGFLESVHG